MTLSDSHIVNIYINQLYIGDGKKKKKLNHYCTAFLIRYCRINIIPDFPLIEHQKKKQKTCTNVTNHDKNRIFGMKIRVSTIKCTVLYCIAYGNIYTTISQCKAY